MLTLFILNKKYKVLTVRGLTLDYMGKCVRVLVATHAIHSNYNAINGISMQLLAGASQFDLNV